MFLLPLRRTGLLAVSALLLFSLTHASLQAQPIQAPPVQALRPTLDALFDAPAFENAWWAALVLNAETGEQLYARHADRSFVPASNTKLYTTAAALDQLGPDYRFETPLFADGPLVDGVLRGNLIVRGSGDPAIGGRFNDGDLTEVFRAWADSLRALGITRIEGDLIGDDDFFDDEALGYGWSWDDLSYWYAAEVSALSFNDNCVDLAIESQAPGMPGRLRWAPDSTGYVQFVNRTHTLPALSSLDEGYYRHPGTNRIDLSSGVPAGTTDRESLSVSNPTLYFVHVLRETLLREGIAVDGDPVDVDALSIKPNYTNGMLRRLAVYTSPPLAEIVTVINKRSQNLYAEQVLKTLGARFPVADDDLAPGSAAMGVAAAMATFVRAGMDTSRVQLVDGSGLSRHNLVTAEMTATLLRYLWNHPRDEVRAAFIASLPLGGYDGTLEYRFANGPARGNVRAKTGTVSNVSTLSGYVTTAAGTPLVFVLMSNHFTVKTSEARRVQDAVVNTLAGGGY